MLRVLVAFAVILLIGCTILPTKPPGDRPLCENCQNGLYIQNIGRCFVCDERTESGSFELCEDHAWLMNKCQVCMKNPPVRLRYPERKRGYCSDACEKDAFTYDRMVRICHSCRKNLINDRSKYCTKCALKLNVCALCEKSLK